MRFVKKLFRISSTMSHSSVIICFMKTHAYKKNFVTPNEQHWSMAGVIITLVCCITKLICWGWPFQVQCQCPGISNYSRGYIDWKVLVGLFLWSHSHDVLMYWENGIRITAGESVVVKSRPHQSKPPVESTKNLILIIISTIGPMFLPAFVWLFCLFAALLKITWRELMMVSEEVK